MNEQPGPEPRFYIGVLVALLLSVALFWFPVFWLLTR